MSGLKIENIRPVSWNSESDVRKHLDGSRLNPGFEKGIVRALKDFGEWKPTSLWQNFHWREEPVVKVLDALGVRELHHLRYLTRDMRDDIESACSNRYDREPFPEIFI